MPSATHARIPFVQIDAGRTRLVVREDLASAAEAARLLDPDAPERLFEASELSGRASVRIAKLGGRELVVRRVRHGGLIGPWLGEALGGPGRPLAELQTAADLWESGAPVPEPAFVRLERIRGPIWRGSVATVRIPGTLAPLTWLRGGPEPDQIALMARAAAGAVRRLHDLGGVHPDLHIQNLLVDPERFRVWIVDLDKARRAPTIGTRERVRELARLYRSLLKRDLIDRLGRDGLQAFVDGYVEGDVALAESLEGYWPWERAWIAVHAAGYAVRTARRRTRGSASQGPLLP